MYIVVLKGALKVFDVLKGCDTNFADTWWHQHISYSRFYRIGRYQKIFPVLPLS
jgi:hypothetical protein